jgi:hypothetical protein
MLPRINVRFALSALFDLDPDAFYARKKVRLVVERGHHHVAPLPPLRVIAVVSNNKAPDTVVRRLNLAHRPKANPHVTPSHPAVCDFNKADTWRPLDRIQREG